MGTTWSIIHIRVQTKCVGNVIAEQKQMNEIPVERPSDKLSALNIKEPYCNHYDHHAPSMVYDGRNYSENYCDRRSCG